KTGNHVNVDIYQQDDRLIIMVKDNGQGISPDLIKLLGQQTVPSEHGTGTALHNLNQRLVGLYDKKSDLHFTSSNQGTTVSISIPFTKKGGQVNESLNCG